MRYAKRIFNFILKNNKFYIVIIVVLLLIVIFQWMVPGYYDYNQISTLVYCDKNPSDQHRYLLFPMVTIVFDGGLGNQLFEVFSLLGLALKLNRTAIFNSEDWILHSKLNLLREQVPQVAERVISIPIEIPESSRFIYSPACCHFQFSPLLSCEQSKYLVIDGHYFQSQVLLFYRDFDKKMVESPTRRREAIEKMIRRKDEFRFKICVHIRRGDFLTDSQHAGTASNFTIRAVDHLYTQHPGLVYLFSNDPGWVREKIAAHLDYQSDVKVMETSEAIKDLYFAQIHCDAVLITAPSSTFGWWLGYLSKNQSSVYYRDIQETEDMVKHQMVEEDFFPSTWKKLGMSQNGLIISK